MGFARATTCVYGFGESMGAALLLESLSAEERFCAIIAESPFSNFRAVAYERAALYVGAPSWIGRTLLRLPVQVGMSYAKLRYKLDLDRDNPADAVRRSSTPIFLIHGAGDINILPHHSELIAAECPSHVTLWEVPGAAHCAASAVAPDIFWNKVFAWLEMHTDHPRAAGAPTRS